MINIKNNNRNLKGVAFLIFKGNFHRVNRDAKAFPFTYYF